MKNKLECYFMRHEGYLGSIGAFLKLTEQLTDHKNYTWYENLARSSAYKTSQQRTCSESGVNIDIEKAYF